MEYMSLADISSLTNHTGCKLPWVDYVEENDTYLDVVILVCLLLTLLFDIVLIAIILAHEDLRKKVKDLKLFSQAIYEVSSQRVNLFMISICTSDAFFAIYLIVFLQPGY